MLQTLNIEKTLESAASADVDDDWRMDHFFLRRLHQQLYFASSSLYVWNQPPGC